MFDCIVIGCGFAGAVAARELAEKGKKVLIVEKRGHIGGNCYDSFDDNGILIHNYGPHIFHTNQKRVFEYLSRFTKWYEYQHEVAGAVDGKMIPIPFNLNSLFMVYGKEKGERLKKELIDSYGENTKVPILELRNSKSEEIRAVAEYVYENIFLKYTMKQWGQKPEEVDSSVTARVPVLLSEDNRYFQDIWQGMPLDGYTSLFERLLDHGNIELRLSTDAKSLLQIVPGHKVIWEGQDFNGQMIYTGSMDELFDLKFGRLPYRSLHFVSEHYNTEYYQSHGVVNYTVSEEYTRITEFKYLTGQKSPGTSIMKEYPIPYTGGDQELPYYAVICDKNKELYDRYASLLVGIPKFYLLGRLAEYKYYNMDTIVDRALELAQRM